jgi:uncharacterized protein
MKNGCVYKMSVRWVILPMLLAVNIPAWLFAQQRFANVRPISYEKVKIQDDFWSPKLNTIAAVTLPVCIEQTEIKTPRINNFEKVARKKGEPHEGKYYDDSDVYKALEAIAYSLKNKPDPLLEAKADAWIEKIANAQEADGYLNTYYSLTDLSKRWTDMEKHEDYCAGHLMEAGVAYFNATGKRKLLEVSIKFANHIDNYFKVSNKPWVSGHQEIELALVKLYYATQEKRYLELSRWFLEQRGRGLGKGVIWDQWKAPEYCQDQLPVVNQTEITGHAVRAMYLYSGAADVASATQDTAYMAAMKAVWEDVVYRNMYITGGIGSSGTNEGFTKDYDLPNEAAYCETCASVGMVFWNYRMSLLTGESKYIDILERSLYNGALDGLSLSGDRFFYGNPLASTGDYGRSEWFGTACCPSNIARLIASLGDYIYATSPETLWVNLFVGSETTIASGKKTLAVRQQTNYPWNGKVVMDVSPSKKMAYTVKVRIPGWVKNEPVPGETYRYLDPQTPTYQININGMPARFTIENGYAVMTRDWKKGDQIEINFPMEVKRVVADEKVLANTSKVALERGPLVYCFEHVDNEGSVYNFVLHDEAQLNTIFERNLLGGVITINMQLPSLQISPDALSVQTRMQHVKAIPYFTWANRGAGQMQVWMPRKFKKVVIE